MPTLADVKDALSDIFPGADFFLKQLPGDRVSGEIVWSGFKGTPIDKRQRMMWRRLTSQLKQEASGVGIMILNTPEEHDAI